MFKFEKNVPVPAPAGRVEIDGWKVGESLVVNDAVLKERVRGRAQRLGFKVITRSTGSGSYRMWRVG